MTYESTVQFKFDAPYTPTYGSGCGSTVVEDFIPEEHYLITAPAADLNSTQYFKLFEKFLLCVGMCPSSIRSGAMSLVFNDYVDEKEQRKVCNEYELTMDEDLQDKFKEWKKLDAAFEHHKQNVVSEPKDLGRFQRFAKYTDEDLKEMVDMYDAKIKEEWAHPESGIYKHRQQYTEEKLNAMCDAAEEKEKCREYNLREAEYYNKRAKLDLQQQKNLIGNIDEL